MNRIMNRIRSEFFSPDMNISVHIFTNPHTYIRTHTHVFIRIYIPFYDNELESIAQRWANQCNFNHDKCRDVGKYYSFRFIQLRL